MSAVASTPWKKNRWRRSSSAEIPPPVAQEAQQQKSLDDQIVLEHVLGMTVYSNSALTCEPRTGLVAYPAGCVLVLLDSVKNKQLGTLHTPRKSITAASFSCDGRYVLTGESGLQPAVRVWDVSTMTEVAMLRGHSFGIKTTLFSPRMREIIVVGDAQDMMISVWSWPGKVMGSLNKFSDEIFAMDVSSDSQYFVTVGNKHVKFYYLETKRWQSGGLNRTCPIPLTCRYGMLDNLKENCFCDVACGQGSNDHVFVVTTSGILCQINSNRFLERWVNVNMARASSLSTDGDHVFVGGCQGVIRMFNAYNLKIVLTLPRPHHLGLDISQVTPSRETAMQPAAAKKVKNDKLASSSAAIATAVTHHGSSKTGPDKHGSESDTDDPDLSKVTDRKHPGAKALTYDPRHHNLTVVYEDNSLYIWERQDSRRGAGSFHFSKRYSSMYHRGCVWDLTTYPVTAGNQPEKSPCMPEDGEVGGALPPGALLSVSADGTLRAWDVSADICQESVLKRNLVSPQCLKIVYAEKAEPMSQKKAQDATATRRCTKPQDSLPGTNSSRHRKQGFTIVSVCPGGIHIATGNRHGRVSIYDTNSMHVLATMHAHEGEITALAYSVTDNYKVLASGSRDRMIHVMDASRGYQLLTTLDDHSSTITAINFTYISHYLIMATSSLDMSVLVRVYMGSEAFILNPVRAIVEKKSILDFAIHPWSGSMAFACQDRYVRVYSIMTSTDHQSFRGCPSYGGQLVKVHFDPSGQYLLTACSLKTINLLQYTTGILLSTFNGHAENITSVRFSHNVKHVISSAVDGCIFLWRLPESITYAVKREMAEMGRLTRAMVFKKSWKKSNVETIIPQRILSEPNFSSEHERGSDLHHVTQKSCVAEERTDKKDGSAGADQQQQQQQHQQEPQEYHHHQQHQQQQQQHHQQQQQQQNQQQLQKDEDQNRDKTKLSEEKQQDEQSRAVLPHLAVRNNSSSSCNIRPGTCNMDPKDTHLKLELDCSGGPFQAGPQSHRFQTAELNYLQPIKGCPQVENQTPIKPDAWLNACCERRRIFKLEARSIKKILGMMRLVTDAMEKDLANANLLVTSAPCPPLTHIHKRQPSFGTVTKTVGCDINQPSSLPGTHFTSGIRTNASPLLFSRYAGYGLDGSPTLGNVKPSRPKTHSLSVPVSSNDTFKTDEPMAKKGKDYGPVVSHVLYPLESHLRGDTLLKIHSDTQARDLGELLREACSRGFSAAGTPENDSPANINQAVPEDGFAKDSKVTKNLDKIQEGKGTYLQFKNDFRRSPHLPHKKKSFGYFSRTSRLPCFEESSPCSFAKIKDLNFTASNGYCLQNVTRNPLEENWFWNAQLPSTLTIVNQSLVLMSEKPNSLSPALKQQKKNGPGINAWIDRSLFNSFALQENTSIKEISILPEENNRNVTCSLPLLASDDSTNENPQEVNGSKNGDNKSLNIHWLECYDSQTRKFLECKKFQSDNPVNSDKFFNKTLFKLKSDGIFEKRESSINTEFQVENPDAHKDRVVSKAGKSLTNFSKITLSEKCMRCSKSDTTLNPGSERKGYSVKGFRSHSTIAGVFTEFRQGRSKDRHLSEMNYKRRNDKTRVINAAGESKNNNYTFRKVGCTKTENQQVLGIKVTVSTNERDSKKDNLTLIKMSGTKDNEVKKAAKEYNCDSLCKAYPGNFEEDIGRYPSVSYTSVLDSITCTQRCVGIDTHFPEQKKLLRKRNALNVGESDEAIGIIVLASNKRFEVNDVKDFSKDKSTFHYKWAATVPLDMTFTSKKQNLGVFGKDSDTFKDVQKSETKYGNIDKLYKGDDTVNYDKHHFAMDIKPDISESPSLPADTTGVKTHELYKAGAPSKEIFLPHNSISSMSFTQGGRELQIAVDDCIRRHITFCTTDGDTTDNAEDNIDDNDDDDIV